MSRRALIVGAFAALVALSSTNAKAGVLNINNWTIDLDAAFGTAAGTYGQFDGVDQVGFTGLFHMHFDGPPSAVGTRVAIDGLIQGTSFIGGIPSSTVSSGGAVLNAPAAAAALKPFEFTGSFSVVNQITDFNAATNDSTFVHEAAGSPAIDGAIYDGLLDLYVDDYGAISATPGTQSDVDPVTGGGGFDDGVKIATFGVVGGTEGIFNTSEFDGNDSATFELVSALPGVLLDEDGNDLNDLGPVLVAFASSTLDLDNDNNGILDNPKPAGWPGPDGGGFAFDDIVGLNQFGQEDGSIALAAVPEPGSLAIWGFLAGTGVVGSRRRRR